MSSTLMSTQFTINDKMLDYFAEIKKTRANREKIVAKIKLLESQLILAKEGELENVHKEQELIVNLHDQYGINYNAGTGEFLRAPQTPEALASSLLVGMLNKQYASTVNNAVAAASMSAETSSVGSNTSSAFSSYNPTPAHSGTATPIMSAPPSAPTSVNGFFNLRGPNLIPPHILTGN